MFSLRTQILPLAAIRLAAHRKFDKSGRKRQWRRDANGKTLEQNASIVHI